ncbi:MAG TPA: hypothetical protein VFQ00_00960 [Terriglobales bacterium]|nr:hypothetical protein [Terriglobales bacterium]
MADSREELGNKSQSSDTEAEKRRKEPTYDPEFEMPDAEQVERDRKESEKIYGENREQPGNRDEKIA